MSIDILIVGIVVGVIIVILILVVVDVAKPLYVFLVEGKRAAGASTRGESENDDDDIDDNIDLE